VDVLERVATGAVAGLSGAASMNPLRLAARRVGLIEKMVPQAVEEWAASRAGVEPPGGRAGHHVADQLLHLGYGAAWGALYGLVAAPGGRRTVPRGLLLGLAVWSAGFLGFVPLLGITRPAWRARPAEEAVNVAAHLVYGVVTALEADERLTQPRRPTSDAERRATPTG
jgi:hypothetical protein